jgi:hypothetical protein
LLIFKLETFCSLDIIKVNKKFSLVSVVPYYLLRNPVTMEDAMALEGGLSTVTPRAFHPAPHETGRHIK